MHVANCQIANNTLECVSAQNSPAALFPRRPQTKDPQDTQTSRTHKARSQFIICRLSTVVRPSLPGEDSSMCTDSSSSEATQEADASVRSRIKPPERATVADSRQTPQRAVPNTFWPSRTRAGRQPHELQRFCDRPERYLIPRSVR